MESPVRQLVSSSAVLTDLRLAFNNISSCAGLSSSASILSLCEYVQIGAATSLTASNSLLLGMPVVFNRNLSFNNLENCEDYPPTLTTLYDSQGLNDVAHGSDPYDCIPGVGILETCEATVLRPCQPQYST